MARVKAKRARPSVASYREASTEPSGDEDAEEAERMDAEEAESSAAGGSGGAKSKAELKNSLLLQLAVDPPLMAAFHELMSAHFRELKFGALLSEEKERKAIEINELLEKAGVRKHDYEQLVTDIFVRSMAKLHIREPPKTKKRAPRKKMNQAEAKKLVTEFAACEGMRARNVDAAGAEATQEKVRVLKEHLEEHGHDFLALLRDHGAFCLQMAERASARAASPSFYLSAHGDEQLELQLELGAEETVENAAPPLASPAWAASMASPAPAAFQQPQQQPMSPVVHVPLATSTPAAALMPAMMQPKNTSAPSFRWEAPAQRPPFVEPSIQGMMPQNILQNEDEEPGELQPLQLHLQLQPAAAAPHVVVNHEFNPAVAQLPPPLQAARAPAVAELSVSLHSEASTPPPPRADEPFEAYEAEKPEVEKFPCVMCGKPKPLTATCYSSLCSRSKKNRVKREFPL
ncbi:hypothetical protein M3Y99_01831400 [Aphelenchoides fujianensis]|nr:hypothetical protein M3Y99_01831400 [Aphelenchoides fujianensis]